MDHHPALVYRSLFINTSHLFEACSIVRVYYNVSKEFTGLLRCLHSLPELWRCQCGWRCPLPWYCSPQRGYGALCTAPHKHVVKIISFGKCIFLYGKSSLDCIAVQVCDNVTYNEINGQPIYIKQYKSLHRLTRPKIIAVSGINS